MEDKILEHWNHRANLEDRAGSDDVILKQLEVNAISSYIVNGMVVAEFGCGNGTAAIQLARNFDIELYCFDFSPAMIESTRRNAKKENLENRIHFDVCDVRNEPAFQRKFDLVYSERMIINLPDWQIQARTIRYLLSHLKPGGKYLMCESSKVGLNNLNKLREMVGLHSISPPWHNVYIEDELVNSLELADAELVKVEPFSSTYYFLSRVVNASLAKKEGVEPSYQAPVNQLAFQLPSFGDCAQSKIWVFEKGHA